MIAAFFRPLLWPGVAALATAAAFGLALAGKHAALGACRANLDYMRGRAEILLRDLAVSRANSGTLEVALQQANARAQSWADAASKRAAAARAATARADAAERTREMALDALKASADRPGSPPPPQWYLDRRGDI